MSTIQQANIETHDTTEHTYETTKTQKALVEWLNTIKYEYFPTFTFEDDISEEEAVRQYSIFTKCLNQRIYGRRSKRKIHQVAIMEYSVNGRIHIHAVMGKQTKFDHEEFMEEVFNGWTHQGKLNRRAKCMSNSDKWIQVLVSEKDSSNVLNYSLKYITNPSRLDRLIIEEINIPIAT